MTVLDRILRVRYDGNYVVINPSPDTGPDTQVRSDTIYGSIARKLVRATSVKGRNRHLDCSTKASL
jgi:hypothetical protein